MKETDSLSLSYCLEGAANTFGVCVCETCGELSPFATNICGQARMDGRLLLSMMAAGELSLQPSPLLAPFQHLQSVAAINI